MPSLSLSSLVDRSKRALTGKPHTPNEQVEREHPQGLEVVSEGEDPIVDIVALHGLNGHREKTWTATNGVNWLRDLLSEDLPRARILCWGYDANTHSADRVSWQYLFDHARTLVSHLCRKRQMTNSVDRPIIFVAHSLGGIVLKSALIYSDAARQGALPEHRSIKTSTYGILFMGTPHQGGNGVLLGRILANVASLVIPADDRLLRQLEPNSEWLQMQLGQYAPISGDFVTKFAYEQYATPTALGRSIMVVPKASAVVPGHADAEPIVIHANHTSMVRYASRQDTGYVTVSEHLQLMIKDAPGSVRQRWEAERRVGDARNNVQGFTLAPSLTEAMETTDFVSREDELAEIHRILDRRPGRRTVVMHGLGGMGKTQLAIAYMKRHRSDYTASIWFNARDETSLKQSFRNAATRILREHPGLVYMQMAVSDKDSDASVAVKRWLDEPRNDRWLLIYDNYDNPRMGVESGEGRGRSGEGPTRGGGEIDQATVDGYDIRKYFPETDHGAVIVTTRSSTVQIGELLRLQKLRNVEDSLRILESTSGRTGCMTDPSAEALARKLDGLPLALSTAGAYLSQVSTSWQQYLQDYEAAWGHLQKLSPQLLTYENRAMFSTWNISYESIRRQNESAAMMLRLWAFFGNEDLWYELLRRGGTADGPKWLRELTETRLAFDHGMRVICSHGLAEAHSVGAQLGPESGGYSVHGCVHSWMIHVLNDGHEQELATLAVESISRHVPGHGIPEYWLVQRRLMLHADRCRQLLDEVADDDDRGWSSHNLGDLYADQGRLKEAEAMYERALQGYEKALGKDGIQASVPFLNTVTNLGHLYVATQRKTKAKECYERALTGVRKVFGNGSDRAKELESLLYGLDR